MDVCGEALIGFVCAHGDPFEFLSFAEEILDQVAPLVDFGSIGRGEARRGCCEMTILAPRPLNRQ